MTRRISPLLNLLTKALQCAYKNRPTNDIIKFLKQESETKKHGIIPFGLTEAFGEINRNELWEILYYKGLPGRFIRNLIT